MLFTSYSRTLGRYRSRSKFNGILSNFSTLEEVLKSQRTFMWLFFDRGRSCDYQSVLEYGLIPGGKEKDKARQAVFLTPTNPFRNDPEGERAHDDLTVPQKGPYITSWKPTQNAVFWVRLSEVEDLGLEFWQTKSFAIMTYATLPGDCIDRVTSDVGDRVLFEQLETHRPPRKVTLSKN